MLRELLFYDSGEQAERAARNRAQLLGLFADIVKIAERNGEVQLAERPEFIGWILFTLLQAEIRRWIALPQRDLSEGTAHLWSSATVVLNGIARNRLPGKASNADVRRLKRQLKLSARAMT